jgi:two-component system nitrogen regulation response regulator GlnG
LHHLSAQEFPGNVRQLENLCLWLTVMTPSQVIEIADLPPEWREGEGEGATEKAGDWSAALASQVEAALQRGDEGIMDGFVVQFERTLILQALHHSNGRRIEAATLLGIGRNTLTRKIQELGLDAQEG